MVCDPEGGWGRLGWSAADQETGDCQEREGYEQLLCEHPHTRQAAQRTKSRFALRTPAWQTQLPSTRGPGALGSRAVGRELRGLTESLCVHGEKGSHWASFQILQTSSQYPRPFLQHLVSVGTLGRVRHSPGRHRKTERKRHSPVLKELNNPGNSHEVLRI